MFNPFQPEAYEFFEETALLLCALLEPLCEEFYQTEHTEESVLNKNRILAFLLGLASFFFFFWFFLVNLYLAKADCRWNIPQVPSHIFIDTHQHPYRFWTTLACPLATGDRTTMPSEQLVVERSKQVTM